MTLRSRMDAALSRARSTGCQKPFRFSLPAVIWHQLVDENESGEPFLGPPPKGFRGASASYQSVAVYSAPHGRRPWLWVVARDGHLGALKPEPVL